MAPRKPEQGGCSQESPDAGGAAVNDTGSCSAVGDVCSHDGRAEAVEVDGRSQPSTSPAGTTGRVTRTALLGGAVIGAGGLAAVLPGFAGSTQAASRDARILNFVLRLEHLKAAFYEEAAAEGGLTGELGQLAPVLAQHERRHVDLLLGRLGAQADAAPEFDFGEMTRDADRFARTVETLEEAAVAAYIGQGANLTRPSMVLFAQIASVEARHAAWIADVLGNDPAPKAADETKTAEQILAVLEETGFERGA